MEDLLLLLLLAERAEVLLVTGGGGFLAFDLDALAAFLDEDLVFRRKLPRLFHHPPRLQGYGSGCYQFGECLYEERRNHLWKMC